MIMLWTVDSYEVDVCRGASVEQCASKRNGINISNTLAPTKHFPSSLEELFRSIKVDSRVGSPTNNALIDL
jgi:hypothetical protein